MLPLDWTKNNNIQLNLNNNTLAWYTSKHLLSVDCILVSASCLWLSAYSCGCMASLGVGEIWSAVFSIPESVWSQLCIENFPMCWWQFVAVSSFWCGPARAGDDCRASNTLARQSEAGRWPHPRRTLQTWSRMWSVGWSPNALAYAHPRRAAGRIQGGQHPRRAAGKHPRRAASEAGRIRGRPSAASKGVGDNSLLCPRFDAGLPAPAMIAALATR